MPSAWAPAIPVLKPWYVFGKDKYKFELAGGCTGVMAPRAVSVVAQRADQPPDRRLRARRNTKSSSAEG